MESKIEKNDVNVLRTTGVRQVSIFHIGNQVPILKLSQILTTKVDPRTVRVKKFLMVVDP